MIDYNLFGMGFIHLSAVRFRLGTGGMSDCTCVSQFLYYDTISEYYIDSKAILSQICGRKQFCCINNICRCFNTKLMIVFSEI